MTLPNKARISLFQLVQQLRLMTDAIHRIYLWVE